MRTKRVPSWNQVSGCELGERDALMWSTNGWMHMLRYTNTATTTSIGWKNRLVQWDGNLSYRRRGNDAGELWRLADSDKNVWKPLDAAGKFNAFNASSSVSTDFSSRLKIYDEGANISFNKLMRCTFMKN